MNAIEKALAAYFENPNMGDEEFARKQSALPLHPDWTGTIYLTTSGEYLYRNEEFEPPRIERDLNDASKLVALALAARRHPVLAELLPSRGADATDCLDCQGSGTITIHTREILCGSCSALGWLPTPREAHAYPSFADALASFRAFSARNGFHGEPVFLSREHALRMRDHLRITSDAFLSEEAARERYELAVARRFGVVLGAAGTFSDGRLGVWLYGPASELEAQRLMVPNGLKLTIPETNVAIRVVSRMTMWFSRLRGGRRAIERTREWFR